MNYEELIAKALKGRSINSMAKAWGVNQPTLSRWVNGQRLPDYNTALKIAKEAGVEPGEAFEVFAAQERNHSSKNFRLQQGFVQTELLLLLTVAGGVTLSILC
ncbi:helix-turn-helix domain-containing protein [Massilia pseudoviolaceinigra]|uniref:helix-turn-helix domain-containing protein n=1 Tax=Massilia pseudoviolaceinigra TaxID=3057165 RepID=UPI0027964E02|nr:helix-turn-helix transcriptional regulator [Massilia sp. CCM 9206]MDQ1921567.1 helix-turn-helix transcriptional regulator [Massilia sp. CCM 9206]